MSSPSSPPRVPRRGFAGAAALSLLGLGAASSSSAAERNEIDKMLKTKGNGPPLRPNGLGTEVTQPEPKTEGLLAESSFHFLNTNPDLDNPKQSVWIFAQGLGVVMTEPDPNPPKSDPHHIWIYDLDPLDGWPLNTTAYLLRASLSITLRWPDGVAVQFFIRSWVKGEG